MWLEVSLAYFVWLAGGMGGVEVQLEPVSGWTGTWKTTGVSNLRVVN